MNQLISKSTSEDINTNLLAVISTQESDTPPCENCRPPSLNRVAAGKKNRERGAVHLEAPISQTTLSQANTFNGKCLVLALCSRAVDFAAQWRSSSTVVCNIG